MTARIGTNCRSLTVPTGSNRCVTLYREWAAYQKQPLYYSERDSWDGMLQQGIQLLERFCQEDRVRIPQPRRNLQIKFVRPLVAGNEFVAYVDAIGRLDGRASLLEWKTTSSRYSEEPEGVLAPDPQLLCYSWITGIHDVAQVVFVRKRLVENPVSTHNDHRRTARGVQ